MATSRSSLIFSRRSGYAFAVLSVALLAAALLGVQPVAAACENQGAPTFYCPQDGGGNGPVCGTSPNFYCPTSLPSCNSYTQLDCASCACVPKWDTPCSLPANGKLNGSGTCACAPGTTLCATTNACIPNLACGSGLTFDACANSCAFSLGSLTLTDAFKLTKNPISGYVLTSDASGNATWQAATGMGGSGAANYLAKFTGTGTTVGNSIVYEKMSTDTLPVPLGVGISTTAQADTTRLQVDGGNVIFTPGTCTTSTCLAPAPATGTSILMWLPGKSALRAGVATSTNWNDNATSTYIGLGSVAMGRATLASGSYSAAFGQGTVASGNSAFAAGYNNIASGGYAAAFGYGNQATGGYTSAFGYGSQATGAYSSASGFTTKTTGTASAVFGVRSTAAGYASLAGGEYASAAGFDALAFGNCVATSDDYAMVIGTSGADCSAGQTAANTLINSNNSNDPTIPGSLMIGFGSTTPALTVLGGGVTSKLSIYGDVVGNALALQSGGVNITSTAVGAGASANSLTLANAANFTSGNYVFINSTYAKITNKAGNILTISPALTWSDGQAASLVHMPEVGGSNTAQPLAGRFGRGYFIDGVITGNGSTYYADKGITSVDPLYINTGNVGVGVAVPNEKLQVGGNVRATQFCLGATGNCLGSWPTSGLTGTGTANRLVKWTGASALGNSQIYDDGTKVGIGTTSPGSLLEVSGPPGANGQLSVTGGSDSASIAVTSAGDAASVYIDSTEGAAGLSFANAGSEQWNLVRPRDSSDFRILDSSGASRLAILQGGNVGIGTTSPGHTLDVNGNLAVGQPGWSRLILTPSVGDTYNPIDDMYHVNDRAHFHFSFDNVPSGKEPLIETPSDLWINGSNHNLTVDGYSLIKGSLGIGNLDIGSGGSPDYKLEVSGDTWLSGWTGVGGALSVYGGYMYLNGKNALQGTDSWLRLNQSGSYTSGVHTPGLFAPGSLNVGGAGGWTNPGAGNARVAGNLGVGVSGSLSNTLEVYSTGNAGLFRNPSSWTYLANGSYGIYVSSGTAAKPGGGSWASTSDRRIKQDISEVTDDGLSLIRELQPVKFRYRPEYRAAHGLKDSYYYSFIAQDYAQVFPDAIGRDQDNYLTIDVQPAWVAAVAAVKQLDQLALKLDQNGSAVVPGDLVAENNSWGSDSGWLACPADGGECACPQGSYVTSIKDHGAAVKCHKL